MSTFDEQTDFSFLALGSSEPATAKKSKGKIVYGVSMTRTHTYTHTAEARANMSIDRKGKIFDDEYRAKLAAAQTGTTKSAETRAKMAAAKLGKDRGPEFKAKMKQIQQDLADKLPKIMTPNGVFKSAKAIAEVAGVTRQTVFRWIAKYPEHYYYIKESK